MFTFLIYLFAVVGAVATFNWFFAIYTIDDLVRVYGHSRKLDEQFTKIEHMTAQQNKHHPPPPEPLYPVIHCMDTLSAARFNTETWEQRQDEKSEHQFHDAMRAHRTAHKCGHNEKEGRYGQR